jgi:hypothetical protein
MCAVAVDAHAWLDIGCNKRSRIAHYHRLLRGATHSALCTAAAVICLPRPAKTLQAGANVSLVLVSRAQPSALGLLGLLPGIVSLPFPAYSEPQLIDILAAVSRWR